MKKLTLIISAIALSCNIAFSQGCLPEGITFTSQEQIDNFQINYPNCNDHTPAGAYKSELDISKWPAGIYCCRVQFGNETITKKIVKVK